MGLRLKPGRIAAVAALTLLLASCGGGGGSSSSSSGGSSQSSSAARIFSLTPPSVPPGSNDFTLVVNGTNFRSDSVVLWNDTPKSTTFINSTQVNSSIAKADVANPVNVSVRVNSASAEAASDPMVLKVEFPKPTITSISKTTAQVNDPGFTLTVNGSNFFSGVHVQWDGLDRATQFVNGTQLTAQMLSGDIAVGGNHTIRVSNPSPNAGISDGVNFFVQAPKPAIASITPDPVYAASTINQEFTITGTNFLPTSKVSFDGVPFTFNLNATPTQIKFFSTTPRRLAPLEIKVTNDNFGPQTDAKNITLIASAAGINTRPMFGRLLTDDMSESVFLLQRISSTQPDYAHRIANYKTCIGVPACTPQTQVLEDVGAFNATSFLSNVPTDISSDARYITYATEQASTSGHFFALGPEYVYDRCKGAIAGCAPQSYRITVPVDGTAPNDDRANSCTGLPCTPVGESVSISGDGRYVAFQSDLPNLVTGDTNGVRDVFLRDMCLGAPAGCLPTTVRIAEAASSPRMSKDARFIYYLASGGLHVYDTCIGAPSGCVSSDVIADIDDTGTPLGGAPYTITHNGRYVAFGVYPSFGTRKTWLRDTCLGVTTACTPTTVLLITTEPVQSLTEDGKYVAVTTKETFGDPADTNDTDVYVIKTCLGASGSCTQVAKRISVDAQGIQVGGQDATFSPDGKRIIYSQFNVGTVITEPLTLP
jgi:hypothetical protein